MWVVEYSKEQDAYHIGEEFEILSGEVSAYERSGWVGDYEVLGKFERYEDASAFLWKIK